VKTVEISYRHGGLSPALLVKNKKKKKKKGKY
jgi:hypothetical protein